MNIAIVANGRSVIDLNNGKEIDSHDIVVRMNAYFAFVDPKKTGIKTDVWSCSFDKTFVYQPQELPLQIWCARPLAWENGDKWKVPENIRPFLTKEIFCDDYNEIASVLKPRGGMSPTTGFLTLMFTRKLYPDAHISLYGYDFYEPREYYYDPDKKIKSNIEQDHRPLVERNLLTEWVEDKTKNLSWIQNSVRKESVSDTLTSTSQ